MGVAGGVAFGGSLGFAPAAATPLVAAGAGEACVPLAGACACSIPARRIIGRKSKQITLPRFNSSSPSLCRENFNAAYPALFHPFVLLTIQA